ncbi:hypothetical protein IJT17_07680 [bacterium]|nr:hypothetical protein [bacterium]
MTKKELIELLVSYYDCDEDELKEYSRADLQQLWDDYNDDSDMFPNGRDYDAEDEDGPCG